MQVTASAPSTLSNTLRRRAIRGAPTVAQAMPPGSDLSDKLNSALLAALEDQIAVPLATRRARLVLPGSSIAPAAQNT